MESLHGLKPEQLARIGIFYLEKAVLGGIFEAKAPLKAHEITTRLRIPDVTKAKVHPSALITHILGTLADKDLVRQPGPKKPWNLTEKAVE